MILVYSIAVATGALLFDQTAKFVIFALPLLISSVALWVVAGQSAP